MSTVIRTEKNKNYTVMSNYHLRDMELSLKAKGLLSIMLSLPDGWEFSIKGMSNIVKEGVSCISSGIRELISLGYIKRTQLRDACGRITDTEYVIYEKPRKEAEPEPKSTLITETIDKSDSTRMTDKISEQLSDLEPASENENFFSAKEISHMPEPYIENEDMDAAHMANSAQINTNKINTKEINKDGNKYLSINQRARKETVSTVSDEPHDRWIDRYNKTLAEVKEQIDYDTLILTNNKELINDIVETMTEVFVLDKSYYTICGDEIPAELVRMQYRKITYSRLESFLIELSRRKSKIGNTKRYLISALYNIASTAETAMMNIVNYDMYCN